MISIARFSIVRWLLVMCTSVALAGCLGGGGGDGSGSVVNAPSSATPGTVVGGGSNTTTNTPPEINGVPPATVQVGKAYSFTPTASDADDDFLEFEIVNKPSWAQFNDETGALTGTPTTAARHDDITINVTDGREKRAIGPFTITVTTAAPPASNRAPTIEGTPSDVADVSIPYSFAPIALDADGNTLRYSISNRPSWMTFSTTTGVLTGTPKAANVGTYSNIVISVNDGTATTSLKPFSIKVRGPNNTAPTIVGTASTSVQVGQTYSFQPSASDANGDTLTFSIENRPTWATFSTTTGRLSGTPAAANVGNFVNIVIAVSDGRARTALAAFTITVTGSSSPTTPTTPTTPTNTAPTISGSPATSATVGTFYSFQPSASDANGDTLAWSIENRPSWASFSTATGRLSGTPSAVSATSNIIIRVSDSRGATTSLPAFSIVVAAAPSSGGGSGSATLSWTAPTQNIDGTALTNLAGYRIVYGTNSAALDRTIQIGNPSVTTYTIDNLTSGTWFFSIRAYSSSNTESSNSGVASKTIQ